MDSPETNEQPAVPTQAYNNPATLRAPFRRAETVLSPQACPTCQGVAEPDSFGQDASPSYIYALGRVEARFPRISLEKEFAQVAGRATTNGQTDREMFQAVMSQRENRYLARQLCWVIDYPGVGYVSFAAARPCGFRSAAGVSTACIQPSRNRCLSSACVVRLPLPTCAMA